MLRKNGSLALARCPGARRRSGRNCQCHTATISAAESAGATTRRSGLTKRVRLMHMCTRADDIGNDGAVFADRRELARAEKSRPPRSAVVADSGAAAEGDRPAGMEAPPFPQNPRRIRYRLHRLDAAEQGGDLRQRMHRLLKQDIRRRGEHPVPKLPCSELTKRHAVDAFHEARSRPRWPSATARRRARNAGWNRKFWLMPSAAPEAEAASARRSHSSREAAIGFSSNTSQPASSSGAAMAAWVSGGVSTCWPRRSRR